MRLVLFNVEKGKKYKLNRRNRVLALGLALALTFPFLTACSNKTVNNSKPVASSPYAVVEQVPAKSNQEYIYSDSMNEDSTIVSLNNSYYASFMEYLAGVDIDYKLDELVNVDDFSALKVDRNFSHQNYTRTIIKDNKVDINALCDSVMKISAPFREEQNHFLYTNITKREDVMAILKIVVDAIDYELEKNQFSDIELDELDCKLNNLKMFYGSGISNASLTKELSLLVNSNMIKLSEIMSGNQNSFRNIVYHEVQHLFQMDCPHYVDQEYLQAGFVKGFGDNDVLNPYNYTWVNEAAAEKQVVNRTGDEPITYTYIVGYLDSMDLAAMVSPYSNSSTVIEDASIHRNLELFQNVMGINGTSLTEEEITKIMFTLQIAQKYYDAKGQYEQLMGKTLSDTEYTEIRHDYKEQFCEGLTKIFYNNLALALNRNNNVTLNDVFYVIKLYEADMNYHLSYNEKMDERNKSFIKLYSEIQEHFFSVLALAMDMDEQELWNQFLEYRPIHKDNNQSRMNASFEWLDKTEKDYMYTRSMSDTVDYTDDIYTYNKNVLKK